MQMHKEFIYTRVYLGECVCVRVCVWVNCVLPTEMTNDFCFCLSLLLLEVKLNQQES